MKYAPNTRFSEAVTNEEIKKVILYFKNIKYIHYYYKELKYIFNFEYIESNK